MALVKLNLSGHSNQILDSMGYIFPGALQVDLADENYAVKIANFLKPLMTSGDVVELAPPGLAPLAITVIAAIHGLTGTFPVIQSLVKGDEGFVPSSYTMNLQDYRNNVARLMRENVVIL